MAKRVPGERIVEIIWLDATADAEDWSLEELKERPYVCERKLVGYWVCEDDDYVSLCSDVTVKLRKNEHPFSSVHTVPKGMIKKRRWIT